MMTKHPPQIHRIDRTCTGMESIMRNTTDRSGEGGDGSSVSSEKQEASSVQNGGMTIQKS